MIILGTAEESALMELHVICAPISRKRHYNRLRSRLQCVEDYSPFGCDAVYQHFGETSCLHLQPKGNFETEVCKGGLLRSRMRQVRCVHLAM